MFHAKLCEESHTTRKLSKPELLVKFFADNPDEELTIRDIATKLNCSLGAAYMTVARAAKLAHVEYAHVVRITEKGKQMLATET